MATSSEEPDLSPPTPRERQSIEAWHAVIREFQGTPATADPPASVPLMLEVRLGRRISAYACCRGAHELESIVTAMMMQWTPLPSASMVATEFLADYFPLGYVSALSIDGPEVYAWLASKGSVGRPPDDWAWTWRGDGKDEVPRDMTESEGPPF